MGSSAFSGCGLTTINWNATACTLEYFTGGSTSIFGGCSNIETINIGCNVTTIPSFAFYGCKGLTSINFAGTIAQWNEIIKGNSWNEYTGSYKVYCTDGTIDK